MSLPENNRRQFLRTALYSQLGLLALAKTACTQQPGPAAESGGAAGTRLGATQWPGGVRVTPDDLRTMQQGSYVLHARRGELARLPIEKYLLPHDPQGHVQAVSVARGPDGAIYVKQRTLWCKSTDGGRSWSSYKEEPKEGPGAFAVLADGTFLTIPNSASGEKTDPLPIWASTDEGRSWTTVSEIELAADYHARYVYTLFRLPDDTLLAGVQGSNLRHDEDWNWLSGKASLLLYRSEDRGATWQGPSKVCDWGSEGGMVQTASGKLLAAIRHQRPTLPSDPPDLIENTAQAYRETFGKYPTFPYKHVFLADSEDEGRSWKNFRQLTTVFGQCYGYPVALGDGTAVVIHDHRYPRDLSTGRALISRDEGDTWEDEAYYMYYGLGVSGYNQSVSLEDDTILTVAGICNDLESRSRWDGATGKSQLWSIRWKPVS